MEVKLEVWVYGNRTRFQPRPEAPVNLIRHLPVKRELCWWRHFDRKCLPGCATLYNNGGDTANSNIFTLTNHFVAGYAIGIQ
ncbi:MULTISPECIES: hypothetical protein [Bacteroides]|uniref:hypothetical protein n=1 Tax=Bacteroides TaxID=816 RepID=UPI0011C1B353|nr:MULTISPECIES: hypothetical protein [Bacteroides]MCE8707932.1 hypothetical protein [Bacteroides fragilis]MCE8721385.1 hypothetical protein [Bacteroides thetaiotaomicron]MCE8802724.1 hypothetical protein [Bacteroides fragilis]MCE8900432.1 hypothetical protein [Bacteroides fragilis]MCE9119444.1 hypothetical protein [Bacteroides fragilis]